MKRKTGITLLIIMLAIGFAAVSTNLIVNGTGVFVTNEEDFKVIFSKAILDEIDVSDTAISKDGQSLTFTTNELAIINDSSKLDFEVTNNSTQYDAKLEMECVANGEHANTYCKIEHDLPEEISAASKENGTVEVLLQKTSINEITETFTCTINAVAQERENMVELVPLAYYAYGLPNTSSTTDYTTLDHGVFIKLNVDSSLELCINDEELFCIKNNDFENTSNSFKEYFENDCSIETSNINCSNGVFRCSANSEGLVICNKGNGDSFCYLYPDDEVSCG